MGRGEAGWTWRQRGGAGQEGHGVIRVSVFPGLFTPPSPAAAARCPDAADAWLSGDTRGGVEK